MCILFRCVVGSVWKNEDSHPGVNYRRRSLDGTGLAATFEMALLSRVLTGAASAGMLPVAFAIASDAGGTNAVRRIAFVSAGLTFGMIMSPGLGALLTALFSWPVAFIALGLAAVPFAALTFVIKPQSHSVVVVTKPKPPCLYRGPWVL